jgi:hypothetical protein
MPLLGTRGVASARGFGLFGPIPGDPFFSSTTLLLPGNGTNGAQNNTFLDSSTNNFTITRNGNTTQGTFSPFPPASGTAYSAAANGGSGSFDGSGDYLAVTNNNTFDTNSTFTLECWFYQPTAGSATFFSRGGGAASWSTVDGAQFNLQIISGTFYWQWNNSGSPTSITTTSPAAGAWHHVAVGYNGTTTRVWLNGTSIGTSTVGYTLPTTRDRVWCGLNQDGSSGPMNGYISNLRFVKGTDVYGVGNTSITVPTAPLTAITNTSLLLNFTNAGVLDATAKNNLETVGNAQISTAQSKWGGSSIAFDGTGDYLPSNPSTSNLYAFGTGDFTIEFWLRLGSVSGNQSLVDIRPTGTNGLYPLIYTNTTSLIYYVNSATQISGGTLSTNTWYHVAVSRSGTSTKMFLDGTQIGSTYTDSNNYLAGTGAPWVGTFRDGTGALNGYIDDLRITKGVARYTANFTAPTAPFPLY